MPGDVGDPVELAAGPAAQQVQGHRPVGDDQHQAIALNRQALAEGIE